MLEYFFLLNFYYILHLIYDGQAFHPKKEIIKNTSFFVLLFFIGFRSDIGGDYYQYNSLAEHINSLTLYQSIQQFDKPLFTLIIKCTNLLFKDSDIYTYNFIFGLIFSILLHNFCNHQKNYFFCIFFSFSIIIVLMGMGYIAQGLSLTVAWQIIINFYKRTILNRTIIIFIASLFHPTALIFFLLLIPEIIKKNFFNFNKKKVLISILILFLYFYIFNINLYSYFQVYLSYYSIDGNSISKGLPLRILFFAFCYIIIIYFMNFFKKKNFEYLNLFIMCLTVILIITIINYLLLSNTISVIVDRLIIFFFFIPIIVSDRLVHYLKINFDKLIFSISVYLFHSIYLIIWINFSIYSKYWIPYKNLILDLFL